MSGQHSRTKSSPKQGPLKATIPLSSVTKDGSGLRRSPNVSPPWTLNFDSGLGRRSPGAAPSKVNPSTILPNRIRRTASLDTIYLRGLFPREGIFWQRDRATQTDRASSLDSLQVAPSEATEDKLARLSLRQRRGLSRDSANDRGDQTHPQYRNQPSLGAKIPGNIPPKSSRSSEEGLNQEIELYVINFEESHCDRLKEPIPEGRKAPVAELIRERISVNQNSSEDSQGSSPDQDRMFSGSSPQINRFSSRAPPDGCERVLSKSVPILKPIPREVVSHPNILFTLKPSSHSAFESLRGVQSTEDDSNNKEDIPKVPNQEDS